MESALVISGSEKSNAFFVDMLHEVFCDNVRTVETGGEARRLLMNNDFDLYIINAPLRDEPGLPLACDIAQQGAGVVLLIVRAELYDSVSEAVEDLGVITLSKPVGRQFLWSALKLARAASARLHRMQKENRLLQSKIEDIRTIDRAKCLLISHLNMSEPQAHKCIEKQAMDMRMTKREVAEGILKTYEN